MLDQADIIFDLGSTENLVYLGVCLLAFEALLDHVRGELQLAQTDEVCRNLHKDFFIELWALQFKDILHQIVSVGILDESGHLLDNHI